MPDGKYASGEHTGPYVRDYIEEAVVTYNGGGKITAYKMLGNDTEVSTLKSGDEFEMGTNCLFISDPIYTSSEYTPAFLCYNHDID